MLEPCQDVPKLLDNQVEVCKGVLSIYRHMIMEHTMNTQTWSVRCSNAHGRFVQFSLDDHLIFMMFLNSIFFLHTVCVLQGADAAGTAADHRSSDEEATGKPKKRQLC